MFDVFLHRPVYFKYFLESLSTKLAEAASNKSSKVKVKGKANGSSEKCLKATSDLVQKDDKTETKKKQRREKSVTPQKETKSTKTPSKIKSTDAEKSHSTSSETTASDKQARYLKYQQWQNRAGPSAPGSKEVPQVKYIYYSLFRYNDCLRHQAMQARHGPEWTF